MFSYVYTTTRNVSSAITFTVTCVKAIYHPLTQTTTHPPNGEGTNNPTSSECHGHGNFLDDFLRTFSFLHVHAPYSPFRLLTNLGKHTGQGKRQLSFVRPIDNGTQGKHVILLLIVRGPRRRLILHHILLYRFKSRNNYRGYHPGIVLYDLLSNR